MLNNIQMLIICIIGMHSSGSNLKDPSSAASRYEALSEIAINGEDSVLKDVVFGFK